ncbi:MAG TPA: outer membrane beta-barrel protein [Vicinamibacterales bacterium]|nr:outer membrane beta-barrel protein [Vicinamibacterales bacterium]
MRRAIATAVLVIATGVGLPTGAHAQGALAYGSVAAAVSEGRTSPSVSGGVAWRFNRVLGLGVELSHVRSLESGFPRIYYCCGGGDDEETRVTTFTTNVRLEIPTTSSRIIPFVFGGGGVAAVTQSYSVVYAQIFEALNIRDVGLSVLPVLPGPSQFESTTTNMALTLGGGASFLLTDHVALDADLRVLHLTGDQSRNIGRFGGGVSLRF